MKVYKIIMFSVISMLSFSCKVNQEFPEDIVIKEDNKYISTAQNLVIYKTFDFFEKDKLDSININLSKIDRDIINKSFVKNKLFEFENNINDVGVIANSIEQPVHIQIKTNKRTINITYRYFLGNDEYSINKEKTKKIKNFMKTFDSIIYFKTKLGR